MRRRTPGRIETSGAAPADVASAQQSGGRRTASCRKRLSVSRAAAGPETRVEGDGVSGEWRHAADEGALAARSRACSAVGKLRQSSAPDDEDEQGASLTVLKSA